MTIQDTLFVPMELDALVVNVKIGSQSGTMGSFNIRRRAYSQLGVFTSPDPDPFDGGAPEMGVHLHWTLPRGLRHGHESEPNKPDTLTFPFLPNRWLVLRLPDNGVGSGAKGWVLASDQSVPTGTPNSTPYVSMAGSKIGGDIKSHNLGMTFSLEDWNKNGGDAQLTAVKPFLTALGINDVTFATFAPGAQGIAAFHDDMAGASNSDAMMYAVFGWYSTTTPAMDPLATAEWQTDPDVKSRRQARWFNWMLEDGNSDLPTQTLLHAAIHNVIWDVDNVNPVNPDYPYHPEGYPDSVNSPVNIAVGSTLVDALSALISAKAKAAGVSSPLLEGRLLEAFQYDLLRTYDQRDGSDKLDMELHNRAFAKAPGGSAWTLVEDAPKDRSAAGAPMTLSDQQREDLAALNMAQRRLDIEQRTLQSMQRQLHAYWFQWYQLLTNDHLTDSSILTNAGASPVRDKLTLAVTLIDEMLITDSDKEGSFLDQVRNQVQVVIDKSAAVKTARKPLDSGASGSKQRLKQIPLEPFWRPTDPVVLVTGLNRSQHLDRVGPVACRLAGDLLTTQVDLSALPALPTAPAGIKELLQEAMLLAADDDVAQEAAGRHRRPEIFAVKVWKQPWLPLYLDWMVNYHFTYRRDDDLYAREHEESGTRWGNYLVDFEGNWIFPYQDSDGEGSRPIFDYHWRGDAVDPGHGMSFSGRTFFTPAAQFNFLSRLKQYLETHHDPNKSEDGLLQNAESLLETIEQWDILSQSLSGLTANLIQRDVRLHNAPPKSQKDKSGFYDSYLDPDEAGVPKDFDTRLVGLLQDPLNPGSFPALADGAPFYNVRQDDVFAPPVFFPLRAGFLEITRFGVTDRFGMYHNLLSANRNMGGGSESFQPILPDLLQADRGNKERFIRLAPRIIQPSRLEFRFVDAADDTKEIDLAANANPICAWVLSNHIDNALTVYDSSGALLGEVIHTEQQVIWRPAAGEGQAPAIDPDNMPPTAPSVNAHLAEMLASLVALEPDTFLAFVQTVDATLWTIDPLGARDDQNLSVLLGRPLAVVRANIQLQLQGPAYDDRTYSQMTRFDDEEQRWRLNRPDGGLSALSFPVKLGYPELRNDGLIGYFQGDDYSHFNAVHKVAGLDEKSFLRHVGDLAKNGDDDPNFVYLQPTAERSMSASGAFDADRSEYLTMLVDPRGLIHALTGILPVKTVQVPAELVAPALERLNVTFQVGPIVRAPDAMRIPRPAETKGIWQWIQAIDPDADNGWQTDVVGHEGGGPRLSPQPNVLQEGWLTFSPNHKDGRIVPSTDSKEG